MLSLSRETGQDVLGPDGRMVGRLADDLTVRLGGHAGAHLVERLLVQRYRAPDLLGGVGWWGRLRDDTSVSWIIGIIHEASSNMLRWSLISAAFRHSGKIRILAGRPDYMATCAPTDPNIV